ncbi:hypothetical protein LCI18_004554 [Fusarium solani-melongenae]|uniref:Uncharacterized protein n=1 Tax=Fusarium solani subsp. cucurbitae TaxID=2747967 RepID=A0ACD3YXA5_FUSSC|nr:hypothetical protein LCI18_004554 [Fusarium solani-melongenae]
MGPESAASERPQCGSQTEGGPEGYNLGLHVGGLCAGFPVAAKKLPWLKIPPSVFFACKHFGTGVLVATAFVHLLPTAFGSLTNPCLPELFTEVYPALPGVIMMGSMFLLFIVELYLNAKTGGHSHGGPTGTSFGDASTHVPHAHTHAHTHAHKPSTASRDTATSSYWGDDQRTEADVDISYEKAMAQKFYEKNSQPYEHPSDDDNSYSTMPAWFVVFYEQYVRQRAEMMEMIQHTRKISSAKFDEQITSEISPSHFDAEGQEVDPQVYKKMSTNITLLEGGILFHSVFVGITIAMTTDGLVVLLTAIMFHQMFEGLGLGSRIAAVPYPRGSFRPWLLVFAFGTTAPIGQAIGIASRNSYDPESELGLIMVGVFNAISSGLLIYAALVNLMVEDFLSEEANLLMTKKDKITAIAWVFLGAFGMSVVGAFA